MARDRGRCRPGSFFCVFAAIALVGSLWPGFTLGATCGCVSSASSQQSVSGFDAALPGSGSGNGSAADSLGTGSVRLIEGDILVSVQQQQQQQSLQDSAAQQEADAAAAPSVYWPNGTVYYRLSSDYTATEAALIASSLRELQLSVGSAVTFERSSNTVDHVAVSSGVGCNSYVGRQGGGQAMSLQRSVCMHRYIIQHEFLHALGYWHEQSRSDRDQFVDIWWAFVDSQKCANFGKFGSPVPSDYPTYDTASIMHYDSFAFSCDGGAATITSKASGRIPYPVVLAQSDLLKVHYYYGIGDNTSFVSGVGCPGGTGSSIAVWCLATAAVAAIGWSL